MEQNDFERLVIGVDKQGKEVFLSDDVRNQHICILGVSGTGKSTAAMSLLLQRCFMGETVICFNWRRCLSLENILPELRFPYVAQRVHINVAKDKLRLPLFNQFKNLNGEQESVSSVQHRVSSMLTVAGGLTPTQSAVVSRAVEMVYSEHLFPKEGIYSIKNFLEVQEQQTALNAAGRLRALCDENYVVDGKFLKKNKIYEIDLNEIQYDDQTILVKFVLDFLLRCANQGMFVKNRLTIFVDECQNLDFHPDSTMATLLNETRKMGVSLILAAPQIIAGSKKMSVVQQCGTVLHFAPEPGERRKIAKQIQTQEIEKYIFLLSRLKVGEYLACGTFVRENDFPVRAEETLSAYMLTGQKTVENIPLELEN